MSTPRLIGLSYSPWTEKARFALDHHHVRYRYNEHLPMVGEALLRIRSGRLFGKVSVPLLLHEGRTLGDSFEIARYAEELGDGAPLFPPRFSAEIRAWDDESQAAMAAGRGRVIERTLASPEALAEGLPPFVPDALRGPARGITAVAAQFLGRKYGGSDSAAAHARIAASLEALRGALGKQRYLVGQLSFADVAMAAVLQFVAPLGEPWFRLGPATTKAWSEPDLAERFVDLVAWRDDLYREHRGPRARR
jgi:glutathione S-transferase